MISAEHHTLEVSPEALNSVRGVRTYRELIFAVTDEDMVVFLVKSVVGRQFVGNHRRAFSHEMLNDGNEGASLGIGNLLRHLVGVRLLGNLAKLTSFNSQMFIVEFGEDIKYPVQTLEDGKITYSQQFGILKQAAERLGFKARSSYWMEEIDIERDLKMFATTRSQFKAIRQMLADHGVELQRRPYSETEFKELLAKAGRTDVVEINYEPAEDRISGLVSHAYKLLRVYKELEF